MGKKTAEDIPGSKEEIMICEDFKRTEQMWQDFPSQSNIPHSDVV